MTPHPTPPGARTPAPMRGPRRSFIALALVAACGLATAAEAGADAQRALEQALTAAQQDKRGVTLYLAGQAVSGAVTRIEPGLWVELRSAQFGRIVVRLDRIDGIATP